MHYKEKHDNLILSDIDEMRKLVSPQNNPGYFHIFTFIQNVYSKEFTLHLYYFQMERTKH